MIFQDVNNVLCIYKFKDLSFKNYGEIHTTQDLPL